PETRSRIRDIPAPILARGPARMDACFLAANGPAPVRDRTPGRWRTRQFAWQSRRAESWRVLLGDGCGWGQCWLDCDRREKSRTNVRAARRAVNYPNLVHLRKSRLALCAAPRRVTSVTLPP